MKIHYSPVKPADRSYHRLETFDTRTHRLFEPGTTAEEVAVYGATRPVIRVTHRKDCLLYAYAKNEQELHQFAAAMGIPSGFWNSEARAYVISNTRRKKAKRLGATYLGLHRR